MPIDQHVLNQIVRYTPRQVGFSICNGGDIKVFLQTRWFVEFPREHHEDQALREFFHTAWAALLLNWTRGGGKIPSSLEIFIPILTCYGPRFNAPTN